MRTRGTVCCTTPVAQSNLRTFYKVMTPRRWPELSFFIRLIKFEHGVYCPEHTAGDSNPGRSVSVFVCDSGVEVLIVG